MNDQIILDAVEVDDQIIPFPLEKGIQIPTLSVFAATAIRALAQSGRSSMVIWKGEPPSLPYEEDTWDLLEVEDEWSLPIEVQRRINIVRNNNIPIKQILIAHEHPSRYKALLETQKRDEERQKVDRAVSGAGRALAWTTGALAVGVAAFVAFPLIIMTVGAVALGAAFLWSIANGFDPAVVVILDDEESSWLFVGMWYE